ncbi:MAG: Uma2 family endonuclease [Planctomycetaceae bacterium]|nr:Uma2 family endonuclease [Planctomycetaceae bacterium]
MTTLTIPELLERIEYPDSDGLPMSDNTLQWYWMVLIKEGLEVLFAGDPNVFVAGNLLWYPREGDNRLRFAPDVFVVQGRPKGYRGSYMQWREGGLPPQVVFEVLSPSNTVPEMAEKIEIYDEYGVEEFYIYDPDRGTLRGFARQDGVWAAIPSMQNWVSPRLGIVFQLDEGRLILTGPDGQRFLSSVERDRQLKQAETRAERQRNHAEQQRQLAEQQRQLAEQEKTRADRLAEKLRAAGIDPDQ